MAVMTHPFPEETQVGLLRLLRETERVRETERAGAVRGASVWMWRS